MHGRGLERNDDEMRRMIEAADAEPIAGGLLLCPGVVLADSIVQHNLGKYRVVRRKVVCGVAVLALALVDGDGADGASSPCDQPVSGAGNGVGSNNTYRLHEVPLEVKVMGLFQARHKRLDELGAGRRQVEPDR